MNLDISKNIRTCLCEEVGKEHLRQTVRLQGWVHGRRDHGGVIFIDLRDLSGLVQAVFDPSSCEEAHRKANGLRNEFVVEVSGTVVPRSEETVNPKMATGFLEVMVDELLVLNVSEVPPFQINEETEINEKTALKYRYLDLRRSTLRGNMVLRSKTTKIIRDYLDKHSFLDIETPFLNKSTPEGARDYLVPSRVHPGSFYALPQSPQIFKQILMVAGFDRYYQIARCFRDEDLRGNRQPEFTQIDVELSFCTEEQIYGLIEGLIREIFAKAVAIDLTPPFPRITYAESIRRFGLDAPDMRFGLELIDLTPIMGDTGFKVFDAPVAAGGIVKAIRVPGGAGFSRSELDSLTDFVKIYRAKGLAWVKFTAEGWQSPIAKFLSDEKKAEIVAAAECREGDLLLFGADSTEVVNQALGNLRKEIAARTGLIDPAKLAFVWVTDFPLVEYDREEKRYTSVHHPFTLPHRENLNELMEKNPAQILSHSYDLVLNGEEIGGGSLRIHDQGLQSKIFELLGISDEAAREKFGFLLDALTYGAPPHGGIAFGLDRIVMFLAGTNSIRDVIPFPKTQQASCLMSEAPSPVPAGQLRELHLSARTTNRES